MRHRVWSRRGNGGGVLAEAGCDVIVLEAGGYFDDANFDATRCRVERLSRKAGNAATWDQASICSPENALARHGGQLLHVVSHTG